MMDQAPDAEECAGQCARRRLTRAGRLLEAVTATGSVDLDRVARWLKVPADRLVACRDGTVSLEPEAEMVLAAIVIEMSPEHGAEARRLYAQAQSSLRVRRGLVQSHLTYNGRAS
jgi:hypothetical protein